MDIKVLQQNLNNLGYPVSVDGDLGPKTFAALIDFACGKAKGAVSLAYGREFYADLKRYDISTPLRISHFLAQACHETGGFNHFSEFGSGKDLNKDGFDDYLQKYDKRADLGNSHVGDGPKYRGRGIFQLTGFFNYVAYGKRLGIDLANNPTRAADPDIATLTACLYWSDRKMNDLADQGNIVMITKKINGGQNGLDERMNYQKRIMIAFKGA